MSDTAGTAVAGHNNPPEPTPFETATESINDLYTEAKQWLDGEEVDRQEYADDIAKLLKKFRTARNGADTERKTENQPFDQGKAEVQARYNPILAKADRAMTACKTALTPWLDKIEEEKREAAREARRIADEEECKAQEAIQTADHTNLEQVEAAEILVKDAKRASATAGRAERDKATASGGEGRAVSLRSSFHPELIDGVAAARHYWEVNRSEIETFLLELATKDVRAGKPSIPGFKIIETKTVA